MGLYYNDSTPWIIPEVPDVLRKIFLNNCDSVQIRRGSCLTHKLKHRNTTVENSLVYVKSGILCQAFDIDDPNRPVAMSLTLPERAVGYTYYLGKKGAEKVKITALRDSEIMVLPVDYIKRLSAQDRELDTAILKYCIDCIESDKEAFLTMFTKSAESRMKILIYSILKSFGITLTSGWNKVPLKLTHDEYSKVVYTTGETINRLLPRWKKEELYKIENNQVYVHSALFEHDYV